MKLKDRIVSQAIEMYNEHGIEYVGMRELAASLDLKLGNITYYFPKKEDLVFELWQDLSNVNNATIKVDAIESIDDYLITVKRLFENQYQYRCLLLSFVHLLKQYESISSKYVGVLERRRNTVRSIMKRLVENEFLNELSDREIAFLISAKTLLFRFWISEAAVSFKKLGKDGLISHYVFVLASMMRPYCTSKGEKEIRKYL